MFSELLFHTSVSQNHSSTMIAYTIIHDVIFVEVCAEDIFSVQNDDSDPVKANKVNRIHNTLNNIWKLVRTYDSRTFLFQLKFSIFELVFRYKNSQLSPNMQLCCVIQNSNFVITCVQLVAWITKRKCRYRKFGRYVGMSSESMLI